jgi:hypothetical protein
LRVYADEYPGYALLEFEKNVINPTLNVYIRSLLQRQYAFLGPNGNWQGYPPYYYLIERVVTNDGPRFRIGPEAVNYLYEFDILEICSQDGWLRETVSWGEPPSENSAKDFGWAQILANIPDSNSTEKLDQRSQFDDGSHAITTAAADSEFELQPTPTQKRKIRTPLLMALATIPLISGVLLASPMRCTMLGISCTDDNHSHVQQKQIKSAEKKQKSPREIQTAELEVKTHTLERSTLLSHLSPKGQKERQKEEPTNTIGRKTHEAAHGDVVKEANQNEKLVKLAALQTEAQEKTQEDEVARLFGAAQACTNANPCLASTCYANLQKRLTSGEQAAKIKTELAKARKACPITQTALLSDGVYSARTLAGCGIDKQFAIRVEVRGDHINWQHDAPLKLKSPAQSVQWTGTIDGAGNIRATAEKAPDITAQGRFDGREREVQMQYPSCKGEAVVLSISGRRIE